MSMMAQFGGENMGTGNSLSKTWGQTKHENMGTQSPIFGCRDLLQSPAPQPFFAPKTQHIPGFRVSQAARGCYP
jgi:hypothetical protein